MEGPEGTEFDVDPYYIVGHDLEENRNNVDFAVDTLLKILKASGEYLPS
jgi:hypothetical protein